MLLPVLLVTCVIALAAVFLMLPGESVLEQRAPFWGLNFAHRGLHTEDKSIPENSLAAFTAAVEAGYGIELDLQLTKDGEVVVFHDDELDRVCGQKGRLDGYTLAQLRTLRLHGTNQRIPLLREVLTLVDGAVPMIIEFKRSGRNAELCQAAWRILRTYDGEFCIESFDPRIVQWFKKHVPGILRGQLAAPPKSLNSGFAGILVGWGLANFLGRPQFIAYQDAAKPFTIRLEEQIAMRVAWTSRSAEQGAQLERENDAVIFELYAPAPYFKHAPGDEPKLSEDAFIFPAEAEKETKTRKKQERKKNKAAQQESEDTVSEKEMAGFERDETKEEMPEERPGKKQLAAATTKTEKAKKEEPAIIKKKNSDSKNKAGKTTGKK